MTTNLRIMLLIRVTAGLLITLVLPAGADTSVGKRDMKRPKTCLVLSGGGARGGAHVGVIKVLEEYRIPIDCITGTSMGALVGGAYASGTSVAEMEKIMGRLSTDTLFHDTPPREDLHIRRKKEDYSLLFSPEVGIGSIGGSQLPKGVISGVQLEAVLRKLSVSGYRNFDDFPIPYRAVATDLVTGQAVVFDKGELANVMRASMSVPVAIAPVEIRGKILVDGMLTNNLPIDAARSMGADIIIAVNVGTPLMNREELGSILGVAGQMISILTEQNVQSSLALLTDTDILISPALGDFTTSDFDHLPDTLPIGEAAAYQVSQQLCKLSLSPEEYALYRKGLSTSTLQDLRPVNRINFTNLKRVNPVYLEGLMETKAGHKIDQAILDYDMRRIYGTGDFEHVGYRIVEKNNERILIVDAIEKSWGPDYFRFGLGLNNDFQGNAEFTLQGRFRKTWLNSFGAELLTDVQVGSTNRFASEFYQPVTEEQNYFVSPKVEVKHNRTDLFLHDQNIARYSMQKYRGAIDFGHNIGTYGQIRLGALMGKLKPSLDIGPVYLSPSKDTISEGAYITSIFLDKLDKISFPTDGWMAKASLYKSDSSLGADDEYTKWDTRGAYVHTFGRHTFSIFGVAQDSMDGTLPYYDQNQWGGFLRQSGYQSGQLLGESLLFSRLMYYNKLLKYQAFGGLYAGFSLEAGKMKNPLLAENSTDSMLSAAGYVATDTPIGPFYLGYGQAKDGSNSFYLFLGLPY